MSDEVTIQESQKCPRENDEDIEPIVFSIGVNEVSWNEQECALTRATWMNKLKNNWICREQLRLDIHCFEKLCHVLQTKGGLVTTRNVTVKKIVALFLHILAHDLKNRTIQAIHARSRETVSHQFHVVLRSILKVGKYYINQMDRTTSFAEDNKWKWFEGVIGALDGTHIKMTVPVEDQEEDYILSARSTIEWNEFRDRLAKKMLEENQGRRTRAQTT
ncbi:Polyribonucleotide nucleotidyltransferase [Bienertia sinuspersici]